MLENSEKRASSSFFDDALCSKNRAAQSQVYKTETSESQSPSHYLPSIKIGRQMKGRTHHSAAPERSTRFEEEDLSEALGGKSTLAQKAEDMESVERQTKRVYSPLEKHTRIEPIKQFDRASENPPQIDNCLKGGIQVRKLQPLITGDTGDKAEESNNILKQIIKPSIRGRSSLISPEMQHRQLHNTQDWSPKFAPMR